MQSIFRLKGSDEDSLTYALGFLLAHDPDLCLKFVRQCGVKAQQSFKHDYTIRLQEVSGKGSGRRDIAIESAANGIRIVVEAKIGDAQPPAKQLLQYACDKDSWKGFSDCTIATLTHVELSAAVHDAVDSKLAAKGMRLMPIQWHEIVEIVFQHRPSDDSEVSQYLLNEFINHINRDYDMRYYDAEVLIQDTNVCNAEIFEEGWVCAINPKSKKAPLYFAPYFTGKGANSGICMISRVIDDKIIHLKDDPGVLTSGTPEQQKHWERGLHKVQKRIKAEPKVFPAECARVLMLDKPITFRTVPLSKKEFDSTKATKQMPNMLPTGFSLQFDELLSQS